MEYPERMKSFLKESDYILHETKRSALKRFLLVLLVFVLYLLFISVKYGPKEGFYISILTWSFFVFCTPIADAGFLIDFPVRLITRIRMLYTEVMVWIIAGALNIYALTFTPEVYSRTVVLELFRHILLNPIPFWSIILVSGIGTFMSVYFGDELVDVAEHRHREKYHAHKKKYRFVLFIFLIMITVLLYSVLLEKLGVEIGF